MTEEMKAKSISPCLMKCLKCSEALKTRKRLEIKYSDFELPSSVDGEIGFHIS